ncbi:MAG: methyl-accepting chemotaxis protein [Desulfobacteraceae bacterium]|nr:methyl-accepting chemotaxis protein [Desulfobacteraceae bacterium]
MVKLTIKKKAFLLIIIIIVSIASSFAASFFLHKKTDSIELFSDKLDQANLLILECRRQEKNFLLRGFETYGTDSLNSYEKWKKNYNDLELILKDIEGNKKYSDIITGISRDASSYYEYFEQFSSEKSGDFESGLVLMARQIQNSIKQIKTSEQIKKAQLRKKAEIINIFFLFISFTAVFLFSLLLNKSLISPVIFLSNTLENIASKEGDLTARLKVKSNDETGKLAKWFNIFTEKLRTIIVKTAETSQTLVHSSGKLEKISAEINDISKTALSKTEILADSGLKLSSNLEATLKASANASSNIDSIASATAQIEEMIKRIEESTFDAKKVAEKGVLKSNSASAKMAELENAAREIEKVAQTVSEISDQINLLSLNAAIEAARAGDAGKGFAVVANEVKELAKQTSEATLDIKNKNIWIQKTTSEAITEIKESTTIIDNVKALTDHIASLVHEQTIAAGYTNKNLMDALNQTISINTNIKQAAVAARKTSDETENIKLQAMAIKITASEIDRTAEEIAFNTFKIKEQISVFKI